MMSYPTECRIGGMTLSPPWTNASGFLATAPALQRFPCYMAGGADSKTLQTTEEKGNETPVFADDGGGDAWNSIGLSGQGVYKFTDEMRRYPLPAGKKLVVSVTSKKSLDDFKAAVRHVITLADTFELLVELNYGCPNVKDGMVVGRDPKLAYEWTSAAKNIAGCIPVIAKLTPNTDDATYVDVAQACADAGADALLGINTVADAYKNPRTGQPHFRFGGGRSGHNIFGETMRHLGMTANMRESRGYRFAIGAVGGIDSSERVKECFDAGADYIQLGTHLFLDRPMEIKRVTQPDLETVQEFLARMEREIYESAA